MAKNTSFSLGPHFDDFVSELVAEGRFGSASEAIRAGLRLLEDRETRLAALRQAIEKGFGSGFVEFDPEKINRQLDNESLKRCGG